MIDGEVRACYPFRLASCSVAEESLSPQNDTEEMKIEHITEKYLPHTHSEPRKEIPTHILLHFSSNVANDIEDPYQIDDIYSIYLDYEVSAKRKDISICG